MIVLLTNGLQLTFPTAVKAILGDNAGIGTPVRFEDSTGALVGVFRFELIVGYWIAAKQDDCPAPKKTGRQPKS